jgi:hypothetical protein
MGETVFAPVSNLISLTNSNSSNVYDLKGGLIGVNSNKSITCTISNLDIDYDRIRIVGIYYTSLDSTPEIRIIQEQQFTGSTFIFTDNGLTNLGTYTLEEFTTILYLYFLHSD